MDVQRIKFYYLFQVLSPVLLIRDLQFVLHFWILRKHLDHAILLDCLYKLGVSGTELLWFCHYLTD